MIQDLLILCMSRQAREDTFGLQVRAKSILILCLEVTRRTKMHSSELARTLNE